RIPGVVDHDVQAAEAPDTRRHSSAGRGSVGHVEGKRQHAVAVLVCDLGQLSGLTRGGDDGVTSVKSGTNEGAAQAARRTGDEPDLLHEQSRTHLASLESSARAAQE